MRTQTHLQLGNDRQCPLFRHIVAKDWLGNNSMGNAEADVIRRIHDAVNRSVADRFEKDRLIRNLKSENLRLRHEVAQLRTSNGEWASESCATAAGSRILSE